jgi:hypothetical protein
MPTVADGKVFVGTSSGALICYELGPDTGPGRTSWTPFQPVELVAEHPMIGRSNEAVMTFLPFNTMLALTPPAPAVKYAAVLGEGDVVFAARPAAPDGKLSWTSQGSSLQGTLTLASNLLPEPNKVELKVSPGLVWTASDGGSAETRLIKSYTSPDSGSANWELYEVTRAAAGGILGGTRYVQRVFTHGGLPPMVAPETPSDTARIPFEAEYILYRQSQH